MWIWRNREDDYAKATYNAFAQKFEHCSFLSNVRETHEKFAEDGLVQLQEAFISQVMWDDSLRLSNVHRGMSMTKTRLWEKKFLIVLDDVNQLIQLETLVGGCDWFGWVVEVNIITTRDKHLLAAHGIESMYRVQPLGRLLARRLLDSIVFQNFPPPPGYGMILHNKVDYTKGLPLAVKILCSFLRGRSLVEWKSTLDKLERVFNGEIFNVLRISFDGLDDYEKDIFLDIACLFKGESRSKVIEILESCDLYPNNGIAILIDKSLVTIEHGKLEMHDMIQEMGREIVRRESPKEPGERSRLWFHEDMLHVLAEGTGWPALTQSHFRPTGEGRFPIRLLFGDGKRSLHPSFRSCLESIAWIHWDFGDPNRFKVLLAFMKKGILQKGKKMRQGSRGAITPDIIYYEKGKIATQKIRASRSS